MPRCSLPVVTVGEPEQVLPVFAIALSLGCSAEMRRVDPTLAKGDLLNAADPQPLSLLDRPVAALRHLWGKRIAMINEGSLYGRGLTEAAIDTIHRNGIKEALKIEVPTNAPDFAFDGLAQSLLASRIDAVYVVTGNGTPSFMVRRIRDLGFKGEIFGGDTTGFAIFHEFAGPAGEGVLFTSASRPANNAAYATLVERIRNSGVVPTIYALTNYAAIEVWADAVRRAGSFDSDKVAAALRANRFDTALGQIAFDAKGNMVGDAAHWSVFAWRGAGIEPWRP